MATLRFAFCGPTWRKPSARTRNHPPHKPPLSYFGIQLKTSRYVKGTCLDITILLPYLQGLWTGEWYGNSMAKGSQVLGGPPENPTDSYWIAPSNELRTKTPLTFPSYWLLKGSLYWFLIILPLYLGSIIPYITLNNHVSGPLAARALHHAVPIRYFRRYVQDIHRFTGVAEHTRPRTRTVTPTNAKHLLRYLPPIMCEVSTLSTGLHYRFWACVKVCTEASPIP